MRTLSIIFVALFGYLSACAIELPKLNLEIGETYRIETTTHIDTSAQWPRRIWDSQKWELTPMSYDASTASYTMKGILNYYQYAHQEKVENEGWKELKYYETGYDTRAISNLIRLNNKNFPLYFTLNKSGQVHLLSDSLTATLERNHANNVPVKVWMNVEKDIQKLFFQQVSDSKAYKFLAENLQSITISYLPIEKDPGFISRVITFDKQSGLVLRSYYNYLTPETDIYGELINPGTSNHTMCFVKYLPDYEEKQYIRIFDHGKWTDSLITKCNTLLSGEIKERVDGIDSIDIIFSNDLGYRIVLDKNNRFRIPFNLEKRTSIKFQYPMMTWSVPVEKLNQKEKKSTFQLILHPGDHLQTTWDASSVLTMLDCNGLGQNEMIFEKDWQQFPYLEIRKQPKPANDIISFLNKNREQLAPQAYIEYQFEQMYALDRIKNINEETVKDDFVVINSLNRSVQYFLFLSEINRKLIMKQINEYTGVGYYDQRIYSENEYYIGHISLTGAARSFYMASLMKRIFRWGYNTYYGENLYPLYTENYSKTPEFKEVEQMHNALLKIQPGTTAPNFTLKDFEGNIHHLSDYKGKVVVLGFYRTSGYEGRGSRLNRIEREINELQESLKDYSANDIVNINVFQGKRECFEKLVNQENENVVYLIDENYNFSEELYAYGISDYNRGVLIDRNGKMLLFSRYRLLIFQKEQLEKALAIPYQKSSNNFPLWMRLILIILTGTLIAIVLTFIFYRSITRRRLQKSEFSKKMRELELTAIRAQMNPHFMYNCLNSIQNLVQKNRNDEAHLYLSKFANLIRRVLNTSARDEVSLNEELKTIQEYIDLEKLRFDFEFSLEIDESIDLVSVFVPPMLLQPFVENALLHGLVPKAKDRRLLVKIYRNDQEICIDIEDNGVGRLQSKQNGSAGHGKGIEMSRERLKLLGDKYQAPFHLNIVDLTDTDNLPLGTRVSLCFNEE